MHSSSPSTETRYIRVIVQTSFAMAGKFVPIFSIGPTKSNITLKARVVRLWWMPSFSNDTSPDAAEGMYEMVLCDKMV